ncbi:MAG: PAS domain S-box protein [Methanomassiliicoccales archaeon]|nr:MAG: PAS domain S-box protein [Methanomassiliicoccales archaeon]
MTAYAYLPLAAFFANVLLGSYVLYRDHKNKLNILYSLFAFSLAIWALSDFFSFSSVTSEDGGRWGKVGTVGSALMPAFLLHFFLTFTGRELVPKKARSVPLWPLLYSPALFFLLVNFTTNLIGESSEAPWSGYVTSPGPLYTPFSLYATGFVLAGLFICYRFYSQAHTAKDRIRAKLVIIATLIPTIGGFAAQVIPPIVGFQMIPLTTTLTTIMGIIIAFTIIKHRLMSPISISLQKKLAVTFLAFVLTIGSAISITANMISREAVEQDIQSHLESVAQSRAAHIQTFLDDHKDSVKLVSNSNTFRQLLSMDVTNQTAYSEKLEDVKKELNDTRNVYQEFHKISLFDTDGTVVASTDTSPQDNVTEEIIDSLESEGLYVKDIHFDAGFVAPCMDFAFPVLNGTGEILGGIIVDIDLTRLYEIVTNPTGLRETGKVYIVNKSGIMVTPSRFHNDSYNFEYIVFKQRVDTENVRDCFEHETQGLEHTWHDETRIYPDYRNVRVIGIHVYIPEMEWALVAEMDESEAMEPLYSMQANMILVLGAIAIVGIAFSFMISKSISRPIIRLKHAAQKIGEGVLDTEIDVESTDEVGELAAAFSKMTKDLKESKGEIEKYSSTLERRVVERTKELEARRKELDEKVEKLKKSEVASLNMMEDLNEALFERTQAEMIARESEKRYRILAENVADVIWTTDLIGKFTYISPSAMNLLGYASNELVDMMWTDYMTPQSAELALTKLEKELTTGNMAEDPSKSVSLELELVRKDGSTVWTETETTYLRDKDGGLMGFLGVSRDVTVRRKMIKDLERTNEELRNAQCQLIHSEKLASIGTLASGIAHEVNNPLAAITGYGEAILDEDSPEIMRSYATKIVGAADRASDVVRWLSKHSRQTKDASIVDIHLNEVLAESLEAMKLTRSSANIEVVTNYEDIPPIRGNRNELLQIFVNMLNNSADAMPEGGRITISTGEEENLVKLEISDTGMGIPKEHVTRIFDPFFTTKEVGKGTGLGLYVASMIVRRHQGTIEVDSDLGKGATFTLKFPTKKYISELRESVGFEKGEVSEDSLSDLQGI